MENCNDDFFAEELITELDFPCGDQFEYVKNGKKIFMKSLSLLIKFFRNVATETTFGTKKICIKALFVRCINDLVVGFHLANHCYVNQFYSVTRPIFESLDLINLFQKNAKYAELWYQEPDNFYKKYKPAKIRELIGASKRDPIYSHFCQLGSHPTSEGANLTFYIQKRKNERSKMMLNLGPSDLFTPMIITFIFSFILLLMIAQSIFGYFGEKSRDNSRQLIKTIIKNFKQFNDECILMGCGFYKIETSSFQDIFKYIDGFMDYMNKW